MTLNPAARSKNINEAILFCKSSNLLVLPFKAFIEIAYLNSSLKASMNKGSITLCIFSIEV